MEDCVSPAFRSSTPTRSASRALLNVRPGMIFCPLGEVVPSSAKAGAANRRIATPRQARPFPADDVLAAYEPANISYDPILFARAQPPLSPSPRAGRADFRPCARPQ